MLQPPWGLWIRQAEARISVAHTEACASVNPPEVRSEKCVDDGLDKTYRGEGAWDCPRLVGSTSNKRVVRGLLRFARGRRTESEKPGYR